MNESRSDRKAEHKQRMVFCPELISSFLIGEKAKPLSNQHFIFNCPPFDSLHSFRSIQPYYVVINVELPPTMEICCFYCPASVLLSSDYKAIIYMGKTPSSALVPVI